MNPVRLVKCCLQYLKSACAAPFGFTNSNDPEIDLKQDRTHEKWFASLRLSRFNGASPVLYDDLCHWART
jgi:hypothetical protein